jgi:DNA-binding MarR family transcriptional regulator
MNRTVELVNEWASFEEQYPDGSIEDFCRYYLSHKKANVGSEKEKDKRPAYIINGTLLRTIGRIAKFNSVYANIALRETGLNQIEEFGMLLTIEQQGNPRKSDIFHANIQELSSGTDMLGRLKSRDFVEEYNDPEDKRSKRVKLTAAGSKALMTAKMRVGKMTGIMLKDMPEDDKKLCIRLLKDIEIKFTSLVQQHKNKSFEEIYQELQET